MKVLYDIICIVEILSTCYSHVVANIHKWIVSPNNKITGYSYI